MKPFVSFAVSLLFLFAAIIIVEKPTTSTVLKSANIKTQFAQDKVKKPEISILLGGDVMLGRTIQNSTVKSGGYGYPFIYVTDLLRSFNLVFVNLENPIISRCPWHYEGFKFCSLPKSVESLVYAGVDIVNLANNHTYNYGKGGFEETKKYLRSAGIEYTGDGNLVVKEIGGTKIGFIGFDFTSKTPTESDYKMVFNSKKKVDILIVAVHWGNEYKARPEKLVIEWGREIVRRGADVIAGAHPHWAQGVDCEKSGKWSYIDRTDLRAELPQNDCDSLVIYSMGNFVFDQMWSEETKKGSSFEIRIKNEKFNITKIYDIYIKRNGQPVLLND